MKEITVMEVSQVLTDAGVLFLTLYGLMVCGLMNSIRRVQGEYPELPANAWILLGALETLKKYREVYERKVAGQS